VLTVTTEAHDPGRLARFWDGMLDLSALGPQVGLRFVAGRASKTGLNRVHFHLSGADQDETVARALRLGATHLDVGQLPSEGHVVLADPEGNEFCVIEAGNSFLAGCGPLGEIACDGTREVGVFWSGALGWPLVWDQDGETAIQAPRGGTKVAWGGAPVRASSVGRRVRFELAGDDGEVERLVGLGAARVGDGADGAVVLADPDGNEFWLTAG
jgi:predicted enzyme related to lactoylglutathione lyase